jgi:hypothetical protein
MKNLTEKSAEDFLEKEGFNIAKRELINKASEISKVKISFPWAMKASGKNINHKKNIGAVILNIKSQKEAEAAFNKLKNTDGFEQAIIQEMILGEELILGIKKTQEFGNAIMFGKGGVDVEKEKDITFRIPPINNEEAEAMIAETKVYNEIKNKINLKELKTNLIKLSKLAEKRKNIQELDINPIIINKDKAVIVDARLVLE